MKICRAFFTVFFLLVAFEARLFCQEEPVQSEDDGGQPELISEGETVEETELSKEEENPEAACLSFIDSLKRIRLHETSEDYFLAGQHSSDGRRLVNGANGKFTRRYYDNDFRLEKIEYWKQGESSAQSVMERLLQFNPENSSGIHSTFEKNFSEKFERRSFYYSDGRLKSERKNYFDDDGKLLSFDALSIGYDKSLRAVQERLQKYKVNKKSVLLFSDELRVSKYGKNVLEESLYYKNSVLRVRTLYQNFEKGDYVRTTYFDGGIIVREFYRDNVKVDSTIKNGGVHEN